MRLLALCAEEELTVKELTEIVAQTQSGISHHLRQLCESGLLERRQEGTWAFYRVKSQEPGRGVVKTLLSLLPAGDDQLALDRERLRMFRRERASEAEHLFSQLAPRWDEIRKFHVDDVNVECALKDCLSGAEVRDLLDIGTGTGRVLELMAEDIEMGVGIDTSRGMLGLARSKLRKARVNNCHARFGDMYKVPFAKNSFDVVVVHMVLHYAEEPASVLREASRVLRPGGQVVVVDFASHELEVLRHDHSHRRLGFSDMEMEKWFEIANLDFKKFSRLEGSALTVVLWVGRLGAMPLSAKYAHSFW
jgi:ubiquinone/menaquinone biosynthesis C-methylase UbiE